MRSIIDDSYMVNDNRWVVSLVCEYQKEHGFLLLQGQIQGKPKFWRSDLFIDADRPIRTLKQTPAGRFSATLFKNDEKNSSSQFIWDGTALIKLKESKLEDFLILKDKLMHFSRSITAEQGRQLLLSIQNDFDKNIRYFLAGDGSSWSSVLSECGNYHNCISWARKKLKEINLDIPSTMTDFIVVQPSAVVAAGNSSITPLSRM